MNDEIGGDVKSDQIRDEYLTQLVGQLSRINHVHLSRRHRNAANHVAANSFHSPAANSNTKPAKYAKKTRKKENNTKSDMGLFICLHVTQKNTNHLVQ